VSLFVVVHVAGIVSRVSEDDPEVPNPALACDSSAFRELLDVVREEVDNSDERTMLDIDEWHLDGFAFLRGVHACRVLENVFDARVV